MRHNRAVARFGREQLFGRIGDFWSAAIIPVRTAWCARQELISDRRRFWCLLYGAHATQIALVVVVLVGLFVMPLVRDWVVDGLFPAKVTSVFLGLGRRVIANPIADPVRVILSVAYWLIGSAVVLWFLARRIVFVLAQPTPARRSKDAALASAETIAATIAVGETLFAPADQKTFSPTRVSETGDVFVAGRYRLEQELGRGSMGVVCRAHDVTLDRDVAIKKLPGQLCHSPELTERFRREARVLAKLDHPGIVRVFDLVESEQGMWIVMELLLGGSLDQKLASEGRLPFEQVVALGQKLAQAMAYAHQQEIIHRDFKPENVLLTIGGEPKIADFGLAKLGESAAKLTRYGSLFGSPCYMSPEQAAGKPADARTDIYALGITLFELLVGRPPFQGDVSEVLLQQVEAKPPSLREFGLQLPADFEHLLWAMLDKTPATRPNGAAVCERLAAIAASGGLHH